MAYDYSIPAQRIDHGPNAYECERFYNTTSNCTLFFTAAGLYAYLPSSQRCWLDIAGLGPLTPDWLTNSTFLGYDVVPGCGRTSQWMKPPESIHYWHSDATNCPCRATFIEDAQMMLFDQSSVVIGHPPASVFQLPAVCPQ